MWRRGSDESVGAFDTHDGRQLTQPSAAKWHDGSASDEMGPRLDRVITGERPVRVSLGSTVHGAVLAAEAVRTLW